MQDLPTREKYLTITLDWVSRKMHVSLNWDISDLPSSISQDSHLYTVGKWVPVFCPGGVKDSQPFNTTETWDDGPLGS